MLKYVDVKVTFSEVPSEISLCINFSGCPYMCPNCHSKYLQEDIGEYLTYDKLNELIVKNEGITCVCFMGDGDQKSDIGVEDYARFVKENYPHLKVAWYSGSNSMVFAPIILDIFDYIKIGRYIESLGGLDSPTTNQRMYKIENITHEFSHNKP